MNDLDDSFEEAVNECIEEITASAILLFSFKFQFLNSKETILTSFSRKRWKKTIDAVLHNYKTIISIEARIKKIIVLAIAYARKVIVV